MSVLRNGALALLLVLGATAACSSGSSSSDTVGGDVPAVGRDAVSNLPDGQQNTRDSVGGSDVLVIPPGVECLVDSHCEEGLFCDCHHECKPRFEGMCDSDSNCDPQYYCEPCGRTCAVQRQVCEPCLSENRCDLATGVCEPVGRQCWAQNANQRSHCLDFNDGNSYCGRSCISAHGCPPGYECLDLPGMAQGQCVPFLGSCGTGADCETDGDCPYGEICGLYQRCARGCQDDEACPTGEVCSAFRCQEACDDLNNPCEEGWECDETGRCKIPGSCVDWSDCPTPVTYCDPADNMCKPGCLADRDCKMSGYLCEAGACEKRGCEHNWYCAFEQECDIASGECLAAQGPHCDTCDPNVENACGQGNECIGLQDEDGNKLGDYCFVQCKNVEYQGDRCPQGYQCAPLQDQNGQTQNEVCFRDCSKPPVGYQ